MERELHNKEFYHGKVAFAVGTGRCGTTFLADILNTDRAIASYHELHPLEDTFHRYCKWNRLPVDDQAFLANKQRQIAEDLSRGKSYFESSAYLSTAVQELYGRFGCKFVLMTRSPEEVVGAFYEKGFYSAPIVKGDNDLAPGMQEQERSHHFFARIIPRSDQFDKWNALTRVGKIAWYWSIINSLVFEQFKELPESSYRVQKLENLDFDTFAELIEFFGFDLNISERKYNKITKARPNKFKKKYRYSDWNDLEKAEFHTQTESVNAQLSY